MDFKKSDCEDVCGSSSTIRIEEINKVRRRLRDIDSQTYRQTEVREGDRDEERIAKPMIW